MESIEKKIEEYAVVLNVNLLRATLNEVSEIKEFLEEGITDTDKDIIVNLSACEHLDSTFLGALVSTFKKLKAQNRSMIIIEPQEQSSLFITLNSIGKIFPIYQSVRVALDDIENKRVLEQELKKFERDKVASEENTGKKSSETSQESQSDEQSDSEIEKDLNLKHEN